MDKPTEEQIKEIHDCSNCRFSKQVAPYKIILECELDMETKMQPHTCNRWENLLYSMKLPKEKPPLVCPLCGKPSKNGLEHPGCRVNEAALANRPKEKPRFSAGCGGDS